MKININYLAYQTHLRIKQQNNKTYIFAQARKKFLVLTPEESVRQSVIAYLAHQNNYPISLMRAEKTLYLNQLKKRCDLIAYRSDGQPILLAEFKAPSVKITQETFEQIAQYNLLLKVPYLLVTNGQQTYCCQLDYIQQTYQYLPHIPTYNSLLTE